ncbi:hypothetical protein GOP47_0025741 [Adiantum capillus-veneris]|uniref:Secreted protein n=1 Tax=Adiantum capillus-veneris TaxID=13818 RepID=A0A9D4Z3U2_ADICA|nr:hypothetical protein GOP47_0025741 [Adiantum capillus-veneris]
MEISSAVQVVVFISLLKDLVACLTMPSWILCLEASSRIVKPHCFNRSFSSLEKAKLVSGLMDTLVTVASFPRRCLPVQQLCLSSPLQLMDYWLLCVDVWRRSALEACVSGAQVGCLKASKAKMAIVKIERCFNSY